MCPATEVVIFSRTSSDPKFGNYTKAGVHSDQYFSMVFEDMVVKRVEYDVARGKILKVTPHVLANQTLRNNSDNEQEMSFHFSESVTHTSTFQYTTGFTITVGTEFSGVFKAPFADTVLNAYPYSWNPPCHRGKDQCLRISEQRMVIRHPELVLEDLHCAVPCQGGAPQDCPWRVVCSAGHARGALHHSPRLEEWRSLGGDERHMAWCFYVGVASCH